MKFLFAGPSLHRDLVVLRRHQSDVTWCGPARWGDIAWAAQAGATAIGLVDAALGRNVAPLRKDILYALSLGIPVAGGAGSGALCAMQCSAFGMIGIGEVYRGCLAGKTHQDTDIAQLHAPEELNYLPLTEALVNIEPTLRLMGEQRVLRAEMVDALLQTARRIHYSERTYAEIVHQTEGLTAEETGTAQQWLRDNAVDQKRLDALAVLDWLRAQDGARTAKKRRRAFRVVSAPPRT